MRLPSLSKLKSEVSGQSGHCSARLLAALSAKSGCELSQQICPLLNQLVGSYKESLGHREAKRFGAL